MHSIDDISHFIWETKYRYYREGQAVDRDLKDSWYRIAAALASAESSDQTVWAEMFFNSLEDFRFLPGGRIQAGAGTEQHVTLYNCFVMGRINDSMEGIFNALKEGALTMQQGGGVGYDFSSLRPRGESAKRVGNVASGPVSFMHLWDSMCATITSAGNRRGAMMACLRCDHPDIEEFVDAKREAGALTHFNLSVLVSDAFMQAVDNDEQWSLTFPSSEGTDTSKVYKTLPARQLWNRIMRAAYDSAEPGVLFIDQINRLNNLGYCETISATNPCGEIPLPPYGACNLGSINLTRFVDHAFTDGAQFNFQQFKTIVNTAVRMLDNVIDVSRFPLPQQQHVAQQSRRIGLGVTGLADALAMLGHRYGGERSVLLAQKIMRELCFTAYLTSVELAKEKQPFPLFDADAYLQAPFIQVLPENIRSGIREHGIRNSHLIAIAPAGTISLLAGNVSSGLEPIFDFHYQRKIISPDGKAETVELEDYAYSAWKQRFPGTDLPDSFVKARQLTPSQHLDMQAAVQTFVDNAISKTINVPADITFEEFSSIYEQAFARGLKGCAAFRPNPVRGAVLATDKVTDPGNRCCAIDREPD